jgi:hypothetical protein
MTNCSVCRTEFEESPAWKSDLCVECLDDQMESTLWIANALARPARQLKHHDGGAAPFSAWSTQMGALAALLSGQGGARAL